MTHCRAVRGICAGKGTVTEMDMKDTKTENKRYPRETEISHRRSELLGEEYTLIRHRSGLDIYVVRKELASAYAVFGTRYGSLDNCFRVKGEATATAVPEGIAHFLEHKMFEMKDGRDAFELYAETGADANAYTSFERTAYLFSCTSDLRRSLEILLDMVTEPYFTAQTVSKEQGIIGEEIKMCEDRPGDKVFYGCMRALYAEHPVRIPIAGTVSSIAEITPELLYKCYDTFYDLGNMYLCICGDVDTDEVIEVADEHLEPSALVEIERVLPTEAETVNAPREIAYMQVSKPLFQIGVKDTADYEGGFRHGEAVRNLLCQAMFGQSSELYCELYEAGLIGGYEASFFAIPGVSAMLVGGDADDPEAVYERFVGYAERVAREGVSEEAFVRARRVLYSQLVQSFDSAQSVAEEMLSALVNGEDIFDCAEELYRVEKGELDQLARRLFKPEHYAMSVVSSCP